MTKNIILKLKGVIEVTCIVSDKYKSEKIKGYSKTSNSESKRELINNAIKDCIIQFAYNNGDFRGNMIAYDVNTNNYNVVVLDYKMKYIGEKDLINIKRVKVKGKYYTYVTDKKSGKIITRQKWGYERDIEQYKDL